MAAPDLIDLHHQTERVVGCYLLETADGLALHDCGPTTCLPALKQALADRGLELADVRHLLLSHIHLDHAGAAGALVREHPGLRVHVSEIGAPHVVDPSRLEASARRLYGDAFDVLWGELAPVPAENVEVVGDRVVGLECFPSPGHASHHVCYLHEDGTALCGRRGGRPHPAGPVRAPRVPTARPRRRSLVPDLRRDRAAAAGAARADPLRRRRLAVRAPRARPPRADEVGGARP